MCVVTGAGRPGVVREAALAATASDLAKDGTLKDSLGDALSGHALAQARKLRGQRARERGHRRQRHRRQGSRQQQQGDGTAAALSAVGPGDHDVDTAEGSGCANGAGGGGDPGDWNWNEKGGSVTEQMERAEATAGGGSGRGWEEDTFEYDGRLGEEGQGGGADAREGGGADVVRVPCFYVVNLSPGLAKRSETRVAYVCAIIPPHEKSWRWPRASPPPSTSHFNPGTDRGRTTVQTRRDAPANVASRKNSRARAPLTLSSHPSSPKRSIKVDTWATRPPSAEHHPYRTGKGSGAAFDVGGEWLAGEKRGYSRPPLEPW